ncbi:MAG: glycoside hydrolase family 3 C-terminal domain-containing protein [Prevotellaceae bacterium]|jgi:beta-glucosidase|nr:glycoside hydrolase family 3 C-terminal domain-containing protein [Prevotellaceae bacterium]
MRPYFALLIIAVFALFSCKTEPEYRFRFLNPALSVDERLDDLLQQMTLEEKVSQTLYDAPAIERLGIPAYNWWNESLHGVARAGEATVFPQAIAIAATFDDSLMARIGTAISDEARAKYHDFIKKDKHEIYQGLTFWTPNINIFRDPRWGRGQETYGEDPYLTSRLAVEFIKNMQGNDPQYLKTVATAKHFAVHSGPEPLRHVFDARPSDKDLWETYLPAFEASVKEGGVRSVMCAYNRMREEPCCGSNYLIQSVLRDKWNFDGYVVSDCWAIQDFWATHKSSPDRVSAAAAALKAGTDLNCGVTYHALGEAVKQGLIDETLLDTTIRRLFKARIELGMFDPDDNVKYAQTDISTVNCESHRQLALEAARKSIVLLKNENNSLPMSKDLKHIAVIGPVADDEQTLWGNYSGYSKDGVTVLQGLRNKLPKAEISYATGCELSPRFPALEIVPSECLFTDKSKKESGLTAEYFDNDSLGGSPKYKQIDANINFMWWDEAPSGLNPNGFSVRWEGWLEAGEAGDFALGCEGFYGFKMWINDNLEFQYASEHHPWKMFKHFNLKKDELVKIKVEYTHRRVNHAVMKLYYAKPITSRLEEEALAAAQAADAVVMCMGFNQYMEGEEMSVVVEGFSRGDRTALSLPSSQLNLVKKIKATGKPLVMVLLNGGPISPVWENENIDAIVEGWYGGQETGTAIAEVLFGDYNPSGRLPVTVYKSVDQLPAFDDYSMKDRTYRYFKGEPLYEFGYGLSYTTFAYADLAVNAEYAVGQNAEVSVTVTNTGQLDGEEVVQLYVSCKKAELDLPIRSLKGFKRVFLKAGESRRIDFTIKAEDLGYVDVSGERIIDSGEIEIGIGGRQASTKAVQKGQAVIGRFMLKGERQIR